MTVIAGRRRLVAGAVDRAGNDRVVTVCDGGRVPAVAVGRAGGAADDVAVDEEVDTREAGAAAVGGVRAQRDGAGDGRAGVGRGQRGSRRGRVDLHRQRVVVLEVAGVVVGAVVDRRRRR